MFGTERSVFATERSRNLKVQNPKLQTRTERLEFGSRKFAKWESRVSKCSLARENALKNARSSKIRENPAPPSPRDPQMRRGAKMSCRSKTGSVLCFFMEKKHEKHRECGTVSFECLTLAARATACKPKLEIGTTAWERAKQAIHQFWMANF